MVQQRLLKAARKSHPLDTLDLLVCHIYYAQADGKRVYFISGKSEADDDSCEVYHIDRLKEIIGHDIFSIDIHPCHNCF